MERDKIKEILSNRPGRGLLIGRKVGAKEVVDFKEHLGIWVNKETGERLRTSIGIIHYSEDGGAHIIPAYPKILEATAEEPMTNRTLHLIAICSLPLSIRPNLRELYVEYNKEYKKIDIYAYFDSTPTSEEIEDINCMESDMLSNCNLEYTFDYQTFELPYPKKSFSRGLCVYRKYEPNATPESVTSSNLLIATNQALLGRVPPNARQINLTYDQQAATMTIFACFDTEPSISQVQNIDAILIEMKSHFSDELTWNREIFVEPFPAVFSRGERCLYKRFEPELD